MSSSIPPAMSSGFDRIQGSEFQKLTVLISQIQTAAAAAAPDTTTAAEDGQSSVDERQVETLGVDVKYIKQHIDSLRRSPKSSRAEELLRHLMDAARDRSAADFEAGSVNLKQLLQIVAKLKLWVPRQRETGPEDAGATRKTSESPFVTRKEKEILAAGIVKELVGLNCRQWGMEGLLTNYDNLTDIEKLCLLCFSAFPCEVEKDENTGLSVQKSLVIKKRILIYLWVGERFIEPTSNPNSNPILNPAETLTLTSSTNPDRSPHLNPEENHNSGPTPNPEENHNSGPTPNGNLNPSTIRNIDAVTIEEIGAQILRVLTEKGFIEPVMVKGKESGSCSMHPFVHSFVTALAKRAGFFEFSNRDGKLTPSLGQSHRACLLEPRDKIPSSCQLWGSWANDTYSRARLQRFQTIQTLINVNESIIDIKPEWFSKMKHLSVLHLGNWRSGAAQHIEVEDQKFMEEMKIMQQLRLFSLRGVSTVMQLPGSVCKLESLIILDLRECHNLEEVPAGIGSLKNLTHLDITNCHLLTKLPKGISSLFRLEVLRGFVISDQDGEMQERKSCIGRSWKKVKGVCTIEDLLKPQKLRELSIIVSRDDFPRCEEVEVFKKMGSLLKLKISWERSFKKEQGQKKEVSKACRCLHWMRPGAGSSQGVAGQGAQSDNGERESKQGGGSMSQIRKLDLWCFPCETAPEWLVPGQLRGLEKLCIKGGKLKSLPGDGNVNKWDVTTLRLKYLPELEIRWRDLRMMFPKMMYLEKYECEKLKFFPCDHEGVWKTKGNELH